MKTKLMLAAALMAAAVLPANAGEPISGNEWLSDCTSKIQIRPILCMIYARGLADGLQLWALTNPESARACIPVKVRTEQLKDIGTRWITNNPKLRHEDAGYLLAIAFIDAWPCKETSQ